MSKAMNNSFMKSAAVECKSKQAINFFFFLLLLLLCLALFGKKTQSYSAAESQLEESLINANQSSKTETKRGRKMERKEEIEKDRQTDR